MPNPPSAASGLAPRKDSFARSVTTLMGGTAGSQALAMLAAPAITRLFSPEDFGLLAVYAGLLSLLTIIASLRYELAIPLPADPLDAAHTAAVALAALSVTSLLILLATLWGAPAITRALGVPELAAYLWLLPIGVFAAGIYQTFNCWALRTKDFPVISATRIKQSLLSIAIQLGAYPLGAVALLAGHASSQGLGGITLARRALRFHEFRELHVQGMLAAAWRYRQFPLYSTGSGLLNAAGTQLPPLLFAALFGPAAAGLYALTNRVLSVPLAVMSSAIGTFFFASAAEAQREDRLAPLVADIHQKLAQIAMPATFVFLLAGPQLFALVFGRQWYDAGVFARWLAPWLYIAFVTSPLSALFDVLERQRLELVFEAVLFAIRAAAIVLGAWLGSVMLAVALFSLGSVLARGATLLWFAALSGNSCRMLVRPTLHASLWALACNLPLAAALWQWPEGKGWLAGLACTSLLIGMRVLHQLRQPHHHADTSA